MDDLSALRPHLYRMHFWCAKCGRAPELWANYGVHDSGTGAYDGGEARGAIHGYVECHGEHLEVAITFEDARRALAEGVKLRLWEGECPALPAAAPAIKAERVIAPRLALGCKKG